MNQRPAPSVAMAYSALFIAVLLGMSRRADTGLGANGERRIEQALTAVFVVHHEYQRDDDTDEIKLIGILLERGQAPNWRLSGCACCRASANGRTASVWIVIRSTRITGSKVWSSSSGLLSKGVEPRGKKASGRKPLGC